MLILGSALINASIMGLQTGSKLAETKIPIIDPSNLKIVAYQVDGPLLSHRPAILLIADVRELSDIGMIIDSNDEFIGIDDVILVKKIYDLNFNLIGMDVFDDKKHKLGKINNYSVDVNSFIIQQLNVKQSIFKSLTEADLLVHRSQIIEINNKSIIVKSTAQSINASVERNQSNYINPFRAASPQIDVSDIDS